MGRGTSDQCETGDDAVERIISAAEQHAEDTGESEHQVGDLEDALREAWRLMSTQQRAALLATDFVTELLGDDLD